MKDNPHLTIIEKNLIHYLLVRMKCTNCGTQTVVSLDTLYNESVYCPQCNTVFPSYLQPVAVVKLAESFENIHKQLRQNHCDLYFVYKSSPNEQSEDSTS